MPDTFQFDAFLSHSAKDKAVVRAVAERFRKDGLKVWFDEWEIAKTDGAKPKAATKFQALAFSPQPLASERRSIPLRLNGAPIKSSLARCFSSTISGTTSAILDNEGEPGRREIHLYEH